MSDAGPPPEEDIFAGMKKKKSKKVVFDDDTPSNLSPLPSVNDLPAPAADADLDFSDLKKKKKKKALPVSDDEADAPAAKTTDSYGNALEVEVVEKKEEAAEDAGGDEFSDLLKKKKKKGGKKSTFDLEAFEKELAEAEAESSPAAESAGATPIGSDGEDDGEGGDDEVPEGEDPFAKETDETMSKAEAAAEAKAWIGSDRDYTYTEVLGRFYGLLYASHPSLSAAGTKKKYFLAPPQMYREGNKRSIFANIVEICKKMHRQPEHVIQFLFAELGTSGSVDGSGRLVIKGRFQQKQIENVLRRYIVEYVTCKTCKSPDTLLTKDNRLFFMTCESCGSSRSVSAIKSGFQALTGKRRAMRPAA